MPKIDIRKNVVHRDQNSFKIFYDFLAHFAQDDKGENFSTVFV